MRPLRRTARPLLFSHLRLLGQLVRWIFLGDREARRLHDHHRSSIVVTTPFRASSSRDKGSIIVRHVGRCT